MELEIRHLQLMVAITEEQSVTRAGARLHLTQSALSHQLRQLEERLGISLFSRISKRLVLTEAGARILDSAQKVLAELAQAEDDVSRLASGKRGTLSISTECYTCYHWLPKLLPPFQQKYPDVEVRIMVEATHHPLPAILSGKLDLGIVSARTRDQRLVYTPLFQDELVAVLPPDHSLTRKPFLRAADFADQHLLLYVEPRESEFFRLFLRPARIEPARFSQVPLTEAMIEMVKAGVGISVLAKWAVAEPLKTGAVIGRSLGRKGIHRQWFAVTLKRDRLPAYWHEFIAQLARPAMPWTTPSPLPK